MNQHLYAATTYAQTLTDVRKALNDPLMTLGPYVIAAAIAALNIYALAELALPGTPTPPSTLPAGSCDPTSTCGSAPYLP